MQKLPECASNEGAVPGSPGPLACLHSALWGIKSSRDQVCCQLQQTRLSPSTNHDSNLSSKKVVDMYSVDSQVFPGCRITFDPGSLHHHRRRILPRSGSSIFRAKAGNPRFPTTLHCRSKNQYTMPSIIRRCLLAQQPQPLAVS
jgi:hypothetical protein